MSFRTLARLMVAHPRVLVVWSLALLYCLAVWAFLVWAIVS